MTKLEEVARAMERARTDWIHLAGIWNADIVPMDLLARVAVEALRVPVQAQYDALTAKDMMWRELNSTDVYSTMISAILNEKPHG